MSAITEISEGIAESRLWKSGKGRWSVDIPRKFIKYFLPAVPEAAKDHMAVQVHASVDRFTITYLYGREWHTKLDLSRLRFNDENKTKLRSRIFGLFLAGCGTIEATGCDDQWVEFLEIIANRLGTGTQRTAEGTSRVYDVTINLPAAGIAFADLVKRMFKTEEETFDLIYSLTRSGEIPFPKQQLDKVLRAVYKKEDDADSLGLVARKSLSAIIHAPGLLPFHRISSTLFLDRIIGGLEEIMDRQKHLVDLLEVLSNHATRKHDRIRISNMTNYYIKAQEYLKMIMNGNTERITEAICTKYRDRFTDKKYGRMRFRGTIITADQRVNIFRENERWGKKDSFYTALLTLMQDQIWHMTNHSTEIAQALGNLVLYGDEAERMETEAKLELTRSLPSAPSEEVDEVVNPRRS